MVIVMGKEEEKTCKKLSFLFSLSFFHFPRRSTTTSTDGRRHSSFSPPSFFSSNFTMPAMRLFGRRWAMGTDDVPLLALPVACFQLLWAAALAAAVGVAAARWPRNGQGDGGGGGYLCEASVATPFMAAMGGLLAAAVLAAGLAAWATWEGLKGMDLRMKGNGFIGQIMAASSP